MRGCEKRFKAHRMQNHKQVFIREAPHIGKLFSDEKCTQHKELKETEEKEKKIDANKRNEHARDWIPKLIHSLSLAVCVYVCISYGFEKCLVGQRCFFFSCCFLCEINWWNWNFDHPTTVIQIKVVCEIPDRMSIMCLHFIRPTSISTVWKLTFICCKHAESLISIALAHLSNKCAATQPMLFRSVLNAYHSSLFEALCI